MQAPRKTKRDAFRNEFNQRMVLNIISKREQVTRREIEELTGFNRNTVSKTVRRLIEGNYVKAAELSTATDGRGRKSVLLSLNRDGGFFVGLSILSHVCRLVITNMADEIMCKRDFPTPSESSDIESLRSIIDKTQDILEQESIPLTSIRSFVIPLEALMDSERGICIKSSTLGNGWVNIPVSEEFRKRFHVNAYLPAAGTDYLAWDTNRLSQPKANYIFCHLGTGIGASVISGGENVAATSKIAISPGHLVIDPQGPLCKCGQKGCVEAYAGASSIIRRIANEIRQHPDSILNEKAGSGKLTFTDVADAARKNDVLTCGIIKEAVDKLAYTMAIMAQFFVPEIIVFSGSMSKYEDVIVEPLIDLIKEKCPSSLANLKFEVCHLDGYEDAIGACRFGRSKLFDTSVLTNLI